MGRREFRDIVLREIKNTDFASGQHMYSKANSAFSKIYNDSGVSYERATSLLSDAADYYVKAILLYKYYRKWSEYQRGSDALSNCHDRIDNIYSIASRLNIETEEGVEDLLYYLDVQAEERYEKEVKRVLDKEGGGYFDQRSFEDSLSDAEKGGSRNWDYYDYF